MANSRRLKRDQQPDDKRSLPKEMKHPKIETIQDIESKEVRNTIIDAITEYMTEVNFATEPTKIGKDWLDCVAEQLEIEHIAAACRTVKYKTRAVNGMLALTRPVDPLRRLHGDMIYDITKKSRMADDRLKGKVLDFGCGVGWFTQLLRDRFHSEVVGIDIDRSVITLGGFFGVEGLLAIDEGKHELPFVNGQFDAVVLKDILNAPMRGGWEEEEMLAEASRVLKNEGLLLLTEDGACGLTATLRPYGFELVTREPAWGAWVKLEELIGKTERE